MTLQELVIKYLQSKDESTLNLIVKGTNPIINRNAYRIAHLTNSEVEDIKQDLLIVLMKRLDTYNEKKGKFITYITNMLKGDPTDALQTMVCKKRGGDGKSKYVTPVSIHAPISSVGDNLTLEDTLYKEEDIREKVSVTLLHNIKQQLNEMEQKVFELIYEDVNITNWEISCQLKLGVKGIKTVEKIRDSIKLVFEKNGVRP